jgi:ferrochelatase
MGISYKRVESLNDDPLFIQTLADLVQTHLASREPTSPQLGLRCPLCTTESCGVTKEFFKKQEKPENDVYSLKQDKVASMVSSS